MGDHLQGVESIELLHISMVQNVISRLCSTDSLDQKLVNGKIVPCEGDKGASGAFKAGAVGVLTQGEAFRDVAFSFPLPVCYLKSKDAANIHKYIKSIRTPTATIFKTDELGDTFAPEVASFSSRDPNPITSEILKPDIIAPGVDITANWPPISPVSEFSRDNRKLQFNDKCQYCIILWGYLSVI